MLLKKCYGQFNFTQYGSHLSSPQEMTILLLKTKSPVSKFIICSIVFDVVLFVFRVVQYVSQQQNKDQGSDRDHL